jgi:hypothetical protein
MSSHDEKQLKLNQALTDVAEKGKRIAALERALKYLIMSAQYALHVGYKAEDCGDHCSNGCYWCDLRRESDKAATVLNTEHGIRSKGGN